MADIGTSWGRWPRYRHRVVSLPSRFAALPQAAPMLPFGQGRSYGDVCLNDGGTLVATRGLDRFIAFDERTGILQCEAGVLIQEIIDLVLPRGWFPCVTPGTALVTVGGAIANDVHGKNHHRLGSFGAHLLGFELQRSDGRLIPCSPVSNPEWFAATIGGLGLTGLIRTATLQLRRVPGPWIAGDSLRFAKLADFFSLSQSSDADFEYTVAWLDCTARGGNLGRGVFMRGNHSDAQGRVRAPSPIPVVFTPPLSLVNSWSIPAFNRLYFHRRSAARVRQRWSVRQFFHPLDRMLDWNRLYGPRGFFQYQCVIPHAAAPAALERMLRTISESGSGSFLVVLKNFGDARSPGMLSFPRPGATLAVDFPNRGPPTLALLERLDAITRDADGAVYPAKDARMSAAAFQQYFPAWRSFQSFVDPNFSSSFWRRVAVDRP